MDRHLTTGVKVAVILTVSCATLMVRMYYPSQNSAAAQTPPKRTVEIAYNFTISNIPEDARQMRIWVPVPPTNDYQQLHEVNVVSDWSCPCRLVKDVEFGNSFLLFNIDNILAAGVCEAAFSVTFVVTRYAIGPEYLQMPQHKITNEELAHYLAPNRLIPTDGIVAAEAWQVAGGLRDPLKQAKLIYEHIIATVNYDKSGSGWGRGDAVYACDVRKGNCTDFHSLFVGQARALGIPARFIMGLSLPQDKTEGFIQGYHCWGQFYLRQTGWCSVDASEARRFPQKKERFFCGLDQHRVEFATGRDINLPGSSAGPVNYIIYPYAEVDGLPYSDIETSIFFKDCF